MDGLDLDLERKWKRPPDLGSGVGRGEGGVGIGGGGPLADEDERERLSKGRDVVDELEAVEWRTFRSVEEDVSLRRIESVLGVRDRIPCAFGVDEPDAISTGASITRTLTARREDDQLQQRSACQMCPDSLFCVMGRASIISIGVLADSSQTLMMAAPPEQTSVASASGSTTTGGKSSQNLPSFL